MSRKLGPRQIELLICFEDEAYTDGGSFIPCRNGDVWPDMKPLIYRGLLWVRREKRSHWMPDSNNWLEEPGFRCVAKLTSDGREALTAFRESRDAE